MRTCAVSLRRPAAAAFGATATRAAVNKKANNNNKSRSTIATPRANSTTTAMTSNSVAEDYKLLTEKLKEISSLQSVQGLLGWDEMVLLPPGKGAQEARASQKSAIAGVLHDKATSLELGELLARLNGAGEQEKGLALGEWGLANLREATRDYRRASAVPKELARRKAALESSAYNAWVEARTKSDFSLFAPFLKDWVEVSRLCAAAIDPSKPAYDVLLDEYEVGASEERILEIFECVKAGVVPLRKEILAKKKEKEATTGGSECPPKWGGGRTTFDVGTQAKLCEEIAIDLGFDLSKGRLDVSTHPFTGGTCPSDVRMTTRFKHDDLLEGITGATHECGHALYELNRPEHVANLPVSSARSLGAHESQSLFWERHVGLTRPFARHLAAKIRKHFPPLPSREGESGGGGVGGGGGGEGPSPDEDVDSLYAALNEVKDPSLVRVEADELSYPLHVVLRVELEAALVRGDVDAADVPGVWNAKMDASLGCVPPAADGTRDCLQDMHWSCGAIGYFPTYVLGAVAAAQLDEAARGELSAEGVDVDAEIAAGRFGALREWLREKVHERGSLPESLDALMTEATGRPLDVAPYLKHLAKKYGELYSLAEGRAEELVAPGIELAAAALRKVSK